MRRKPNTVVDREIRMIVSGDVPAMYWPSGSEGRGKPVVKPHAKTTRTCVSCGRLHSAKEHDRHAGKPGRAGKSSRTRVAEQVSPHDIQTIADDAVRIMPKVERLGTGSAARGRYDRQWVYVAGLWRALKKDPRYRSMPIEHFKWALARANQQQLLRLARMDIVDDKDPEEIRESEISDLGSQFHLVARP